MPLTCKKNGSKMTCFCVKAEILNRRVQGKAHLANASNQTVRDFGLNVFVFFAPLAESRPCTVCLNDFGRVPLNGRVRDFGRKKPEVREIAVGSFF